MSGQSAESACTCAGSLIETNNHEDVCAISEARWEDPEYVAAWERRVDGAPGCCSGQGGRGVCPHCGDWHADDWSCCPHAPSNPTVLRDEVRP